MSDKIEKDEEVTSKSTLDIIKEMTSKIKNAIKDATKDIKAVDTDTDDTAEKDVKENDTCATDKDNEEVVK